MDSARLTIRPFVLADFEDYYAYVMDPELQKMLGLNDVTDRASAQIAFDWLRNNRTFLALELKETGHVIGHIAVHPPYEAAAQLRKNRVGCSLSFAISKSHQRRGLMEEALRQVVTSLFQSGIEYLDCEYTADNFPSRCLQEKLGFRKTAVEQFDGIELNVCILDRTFP